MKTLHAAMLGFTLAAASAMAQVAADDGKTPKTTAPSKATETKKAPAAKGAASASTATDAAKKPASPAKKKPAPAPKKAATPAKASAPTPTSKDPNVRIYKAGSPDAPKLRDKDGNVIPTNPDAYDISSAQKK
jgi:hypothetical protein